MANPDSLCYLPNQAALIHLVITPTGSEYDNQVYPKKRNTAMHVFYMRNEELELSLK
jgi:hypothetical protein